MSGNQQKTVEILTPLLGQYLAIKLAERLSAKIADLLALRLRQIISEAELRGSLHAYDRSA